MKKTKSRDKKGVRRNKIRSHLKRLKMPQSELARLCNTTPSHISEIVNEKRTQISLSMAMLISKALDTPIEDIFIPDK